MSVTSADRRSAQRKALDEQIAAKPRVAIPELPTDAKPTPVEEHLRTRVREPQAFVGIVENGMIRLVDPAAALPERSRVIVVTGAGVSSSFEFRRFRGSSRAK